MTIPRLDIARGTKIAFIGESGSGKSTLLELLAMILRPTSYAEFTFRPRGGHPYDIGEVWRSGSSDELAGLRSRYIGYVLQHGGLLPYVSVRENVNLSRRLLELPDGSVADALAERLRISQQLDKLPAELSVGQRQRAAIARALAHEPPIVIADEPTESVDPLTAERIMRMLTDLTEALGVTLVLSTHAHHLVEKIGLETVELKVEAADAHTMRSTVSYG